MLHWLTIYSRSMCDYRRGFKLGICIIDHLCTRLELQAITAPPLFSTIQKLPQRPLSLFPVCPIFTNRSLVTTSNSEDSSASRAQVLSSQTPVQN
jgi:hypothetical protein